MQGLMDGVIPAEPETYELVRREAARLGRLVTDVERLSRLEAGAETIKPRELVVAEAVEGVVAPLRPQFLTRTSRSPSIARSRAHGYGRIPTSSRRSWGISSRTLSATRHPAARSRSTCEPRTGWSPLPWRTTVSASPPTTYPMSSRGSTGSTNPDPARAEGAASAWRWPELSRSRWAAPSSAESVPGQLHPLHVPPAPGPVACRAFPRVPGDGKTFTRPLRSLHPTSTLSGAYSSHPCRKRHPAHMNEEDTVFKTTKTKVIGLIAVGVVALGGSHVRHDGLGRRAVRPRPRAPAPIAQTATDPQLRAEHPRDAQGSHGSDRRGRREVRRPDDRPHAEHQPDSTRAKSRETSSSDSRLLYRPAI